MSVRMSDPRKKNQFQVWTDAADDSTKLNLKSSEEVTRVLETLDEVEKQSATAKLMIEYPHLEGVINDPSLTPFQKKMKMMPVFKGIREERAQLSKDLVKLDDKVAFLKTVAPAADAYVAWKAIPPKLEQNDCSRLHNLVAGLKKQYRFMPETVTNGNPSDYPWHEVVPFVVQHDWAAAFANATDYDSGQFNLPYEKCAFEFRISGHSVTVLACQDSKEHEPSYQFYVALAEYWVSEDQEKDKPPAYGFALKQIKAICVALDAQVATHNVMRSSEKVNKRRELEGKVPFFSYHVVSLIRRVRVGNALPGGGGTKRRLHFRRGHWRHYEKFKTWVRWCLAGDPDLGFIDKEYRL